MSRETGLLAMAILFILRSDSIWYVCGIVHISVRLESIILCYRSSSLSLITLLSEPTNYDVLLIMFCLLCAGHCVLLIVAGIYVFSPTTCRTCSISGRNRTSSDTAVVFSLLSL